jgi:hypothetical protein
MPIETLALGPVVATLLAAGPAEAPGGLRHRLEYNLAPELTLVGLAYGARAEVLLRLGEEGSASRLRLAPGLLVGPEFVYTPLALGYRALFNSRGLVRPLVGAGLEYQQRTVDDAPPARQLALYLEGGLAVGLGRHLSVGLVGGLDATFLGGPGAGLSVRLQLGWTP